MVLPELYKTQFCPSWPAFCLVDFHSRRRGRRIAECQNQGGSCLKQENFRKELSL